jgi:hypothetical protein
MSTKPDSPSEFVAAAGEEVSQFDGPVSLDDTGALQPVAVEEEEEDEDPALLGGEEEDLPGEEGSS